MSYFAVLIPFFICSAFFSAAETAFSSANKIRLKNLANDGNKKAAEAWDIIDDFEGTLFAILIGNNLVNIGATSVATVLLVSFFGDGGAAIATGVMTISILIAGEILPKSYAKKNAEKFALLSAPILRFFKFILKPIIFILIKLSDLVSGAKKDEPFITEDEFRFMIGEIADEGVIREENSELLDAAIEFYHTSVGQIVTPRVDILLIDVESDFSDILNIIEKSIYSRIPVYRDSTDNIVGILYKSEFLIKLYKEQVFDIEDILHPALFIPASVQISKVLKTLQKKQVHLAVINDEHGGTQGIVTLEDILEELVGEIWDELDSAQYAITNVSKDIYRITGDAEIEDVFELFDINAAAVVSESRTAGGFVFEQLQRIPESGDKFVFEDVLFTIEVVKDNRVLSLIAKRNDHEQ